MLYVRYFKFHLIDQSRYYYSLYAKSLTPLSCNLGLPRIRYSFPVKLLTVAAALVSGNNKFSSVCTNGMISLLVRILEKPKSARCSSVSYPDKVWFRFQFLKSLQILREHSFRAFGGHFKSFSRIVLYLYGIEVFVTFQTYKCILRDVRCVQQFATFRAYCIGFKWFHFFPFSQLRVKKRNRSQSVPF